MEQQFRADVFTNPDERLFEQFGILARQHVESMRRAFQMAAFRIDDLDGLSVHRDPRLEVPYAINGISEVSQEPHYFGVLQALRPVDISSMNLEDDVRSPPNRGGEVTVGAFEDLEFRPLQIEHQYIELFDP